MVHLGHQFNAGDGVPTPPPETSVLITSMTSIAAVQVLTLLLATHLRIKRDYWVDPIPAWPPFIVRLASHLSTATLGALHALVDTIPDAVMCSAPPDHHQHPYPSRFKWASHPTRHKT